MKLKRMFKVGLVAGLLSVFICACGGGTVSSTSGNVLPDVPVGVTASQGTIADSVLVTWDAVDNADYYVVYKAIDTAESFKVISSTVKGTEYNDTAVYKGQVYYYRVSAAIGNKWSEPCLEVSGFLMDNTPVPPQVVTGPGTDPVNCVIGSITVTWDDVDAAQSYVVLRSEHKYGGYTEVATVTDASYTDTNVSADTIYWYKIISVNSESQQGVPSEPARGLALQQLPVWAEGAVITATDNYMTKIQITWPAAQYAATYTLYRSDSSDPIASNITDLTYEDRGFAAKETEYTYRVVAISSGGSSELADTDTGMAPTVGDADPIDPPTGIFASKGKTNLITITWNAEQDSIGYNVYRNTTNSPETAVKINAAPITVLTYDNAMNPVVADKTTYYYWVTALNATSTETAKSTVASGYANPAAPVVPVSISTAADYAGKTVTVTWAAGDTCTKRYTVYRSNDGGETYNPVSENQTVTTYVESLVTEENGTVEAGVTYYYRIKAINDVGESAQSDAVTGLYALRVPTGLAVNTGSLLWHWAGALWCSYYKYTVTWTAVNGASGYEVGFYYSSAWHNVIVTGGSTTTLTWDTPNYGGNDYNVRIRAINATPDPDIYSAYSAEVN